ncbi:hypothetical protein B0H19DRAFT_1080600 [Mycena capillaripes]|nr:hypothetical protein B0H19DRAFT_1080600 [Mycena capillaripes]
MLDSVPVVFFGGGEALIHRLQRFCETALFDGLIYARLQPCRLLPQPGAHTAVGGSPAAFLRRLQRRGAPRDQNSAKVLRRWWWYEITRPPFVQVFNAAIREFGTYNRLTNNCRTFLQWGCMGILDLTSDLGAPLLFGQMAVMMYRSILREFCRWFWSVRWGPDWESSVHFEDDLVDLADHDVDLRHEQAAIRRHIGDQYDTGAS